MIRCIDCKHCKTDMDGYFLGCPMTDWVDDHIYFGSSENATSLIKPPFCNCFVATAELFK